MFLSTTTNNLDAKGRVSVPSDFRAVVGDGAFDGIVLWPSFDGDYLEGGGLALMQEYLDSLETMDHYDEGRMALQRAIFAESRKLSFDSGGRVTLPKDLAEYAGLNGRATFVGLGRRFEIWSPESYESHIGDVRRLARENRNRLISLRRRNGSEGAR
ncbi:MAG: division/cell wall cluster transcriptional repressor MraZ [Hellea sp.]|nr:division/cell wall cluster transcriptional repressor MraZ [Hellea sp.]